MSTPHVSGVAALGLSYAKQLGKTFEPDEFRDMVLASVNDLDPYLTGVKKHNNGTMNLVEYKGKMGSGMIDAYKMLMAVRGTPAITVEQDKPTTISLSKYYGDVTALSCTLEVSDAVKDKLGLTFTVEGNNATITCSKQSAGLVTVKRLCRWWNVDEPRGCDHLPCEGGFERRLAVSLSLIEKWRSDCMVAPFFCLIISIRRPVRPEPIDML